MPWPWISHRGEHNNDHRGSNLCRKRKQRAKNAPLSPKSISATASEQSFFNLLMEFSTPWQWEDNSEDNQESITIGCRDRLRFYIQICLWIWLSYKQPYTFHYYQFNFQNPEKVLGEMSEHLGLNHSAQFIAEVAEATKFDNMKKSSYEDEARFRDQYGSKFSFCRKGLS